MEDTTYTITLSDGTELSGLRLSGNNFISKEPIDAAQFEYNLSPVKISHDEIVEIHENMQLNHIQEIDGEWYFILLDFSPQELWQQKVNADIIYLSMMTGAGLD